MLSPSTARKAASRPHSQAVLMRGEGGTERLVVLPFGDVLLESAAPLV